MRYIAAYLLAVLGGNAAPSSDDVTAILSSAGVDVDAARLKQVMAELEGKDVNELIEAGSSKLAKFGGSAPAAGAAGGAGGDAGEAAVVEEEAEEEEADLGAGMDMFGGGSDY